MSNVISKTFSSDAIFKVEGLPSLGIVIAGDELTTLKVGDTFTQQDIYNGNLRYKNTTGGTSSTGEIFDYLRFSILSEGKVVDSSVPRANCLPTPEVTIPSNGVYTLKFVILVMPPPIKVNEGSITTSGNDVTCLNRGLLYYRNDNHEDNLMVYKVTTLPEFGKLLIYGVPATVGSTFTQQDIDNGKVCIRGDKLSGGNTLFSYTVTNKWNKSVSGSFKIVLPPSFVITLPDKIYARELTAFCYSWLTHEGVNAGTKVSYMLKLDQDFTVHRAVNFWPDFGLDLDTAHKMYMGDVNPITFKQFQSGNYKGGPALSGPWTPAALKSFEPITWTTEEWNRLVDNMPKLPTKKEGWYWYTPWVDEEYYNSVVGGLFHVNFFDQWSNWMFSYSKPFTNYVRSYQADYISRNSVSTGILGKSFNLVDMSKNQAHMDKYKDLFIDHALNYWYALTVGKVKAASEIQDEFWIALMPSYPFTEALPTYKNTIGYYGHIYGNSNRQYSLYDRRSNTPDKVRSSGGAWSLLTPQHGKFTATKGSQGAYRVSSADYPWLRFWPHNLYDWSCTPWVAGMAGEEYKVKIVAIDWATYNVAEKEITIVVTETGYNSNGVYEEWESPFVDPDPPAPKPPELQLNVVNTAAELAAAQAKSTEVPDPNTVFNAYLRFATNSLYMSAADTPITSDASDWHYDSATDRIVTEKNSSRITGFLNPTKEDNFDLSVEIYSLDSDDDMNGIVIAAGQTADGKMQTISAVRMNGGIPFDGKSWLLISTEGDKSTILVDGSSAAGPFYPTELLNPDSGWAKSGKTVISISRSGKEISVKTSEFGSSTVLDSTELKYTIPDDSILASESYWGFMNYSQRNTYFKIQSFASQKNTEMIYDVSVTPPKIWKFVSPNWVEDTRNFFEVVGQPKVISNPTTGKKYYVNNNTVTLMV